MMESMGTQLQGSGERSRKYLSLVLQGVASVGQKPIADALDVSEATISRHLSEGHLERSIRVVERAGCKVVPRDMKCFNPKDIDAILHMARCWMRHVESAEQLWEQE